MHLKKIVLAWSSYHTKFVSFLSELYDKVCKTLYLVHISYMYLLLLVKILLPALQKQSSNQKVYVRKRTSS